MLRIAKSKVNRYLSNNEDMSTITLIIFLQEKSTVERNKKNIAFYFVISLLYAIFAKNFVTKNFANG